MSPWGPPNRPGLITSDGGMTLKLKTRGHQSRLVLCWIGHADVIFRLLYEAEIQKRRQTPLVLCWIWLREANTTILYGVQHYWKRQTLPSYVKVRLIQRDKHCRTVLWRWVWLRGKLCHLVWCWLWHREANTAVLCGVEYYWEPSSDGSMWRDNERDAQV